MVSTSAHTIIIGAGPAGLACATELARAGREVLVLERLAVVGPKPCAGGLPTGAVPAGLPPDLLERSFRQQRIITPRQDFQIQGPAPIIHTVNRERLGAWMREQAEAAGATILTNVRAQCLEGGRSEKPTVITSQGTLSARHLVGADGSNSLVRRHLQLPLELAGIGITYQVPGDFAEMEWHLEPELFGSGYAWIFPHRGSASVGVYAFRRQLRSHLLHERFQSWADRRGVDLSGCRHRAALVSFDHRGCRFGNLWLAGDAAGLASGLTGEGIAGALYSGRATATAILQETGQTPLLTALLPSHTSHRRLVCLASRWPKAGRLILEIMAAGLRRGRVKPAVLELITGNDEGKK